MNPDPHDATQKELKPKRDLHWGEVCGSGEEPKFSDRMSLDDDDEEPEEPQRSYPRASLLKRKSRSYSMSEPRSPERPDEGRASTPDNDDDEDGSDNIDHEPNPPSSNITKRYQGVKDKPPHPQRLVRVVGWEAEDGRRWQRETKPESDTGMSKADDEQEDEEGQAALKVKQDEIKNGKRKVSEGREKGKRKKRRKGDKLQHSQDR